MKFEIHNRWSGAVQYTCELSAEVADKSYSIQLGFAIKKAIAEKANLHETNLRDASLRDADLSDASLRGADLSGANLNGADLRYANLSGADLRDASLCGAHLRYADLNDANLCDADLSDASLRGADLSGANLNGADLRYANLSGADLSDASLCGAHLRYADLTDPDLSAANLQLTRADFHDVLSWAPAEVPALISALKEGRINGSAYTGTCACLVGTIANARAVDVSTLPRDSHRPIERFFMGIREGDMPGSNQHCAIVLEWAQTWLATMQAAFAPKNI